MAKTDNLEDIKETLKIVAMQKDPRIDRNIINEIVDIEFQNLDEESRVVGRKKVQKRLKDYIEHSR